MTDGVAARRPLHPAAAWAHLALVAACVLAYWVDRDGSVGLAAYALAMIGSLGAISVGVRRNRPALRRPWRYLQLAMVLALVGTAIPVALPEDPAAALAGNLVALLGYLTFLAWPVTLLRAHDTERGGDAAADGALVGVAAFLLAWVLLVSPMLAGTAPLSAERLLSAVFPILDAVLVFLFARASFLASATGRALWLVVAGFLCLLVGDLGYAVDAVRPLAIDPALLELPYLGTYGLVAAGALHPTMTALTTPEPAVVGPLRRGRLLLLSLAVAVPALLVFTRPLATRVDRAVVSGGLLVLAAVFLWRTVRAVDSHAASELRLAHHATHDSLTGLPNRAGLLAALQQTLLDEEAEPEGGTATLFCDLDGFKFVNDSWGHSAGDELLVAVGERLAEASPHATLVSRLGGDEFVVLCPRAQAEPVSRALLDQFTSPVVLGIGEVYISASIGIACSAGRPRGCSAEELIRDADIAMYRAKGEGGNRWAVFDDSMRASVTRRVTLQAELRRGLEQGQFVVHYQPIVRLHDSVLLGFEALVRWDHPTRGLVPPREFIPLIEDGELIGPLGEFVLRAAADHLAGWREVPGAAALTMSVNVAGRQLRDPAFVGVVSSALRLARLPGDALVLEITESAVVEESPATRATVEALRRLGVGLSVDDFGTGHSSLRYLKRFPLTEVKLDRAFVDGLGSRRDDEAIVVAVLAMASALNLRTVAEGVETVEQRDRLRALGCHAAQGFLFGRPVADWATGVVARTAAERELRV